MEKKERKKERERERHTYIQKENGQLLLFDGQSLDDKDHAIVFSQMFWSGAIAFLLELFDSRLEPY